MVGIFNQLKYARWTEGIVIYLIVPMILGILLGAGLVAIVRYPLIMLVVASLVSIAAVIIRSKLRSHQPTIANSVKRETVGTGKRR
jgi:uncharacterized membrane protein YfcA